MLFLRLPRLKAIFPKLTATIRGFDVGAGRFRICLIEGHVFTLDLLLRDKKTMWCDINESSFELNFKDVSGSATWKNRGAMTLPREKFTLRIGLFAEQHSFCDRYVLSQSAFPHDVWRFRYFWHLPQTPSGECCRTLWKTGQVNVELNQNLRKIIFLMHAVFQTGCSKTLI